MRWTDVLPKYWEQLEEDMRRTGEFNAARLKHSKLRQALYAGRAVARGNMDGFVPRSPICGYAARLKSKDAVWQEFAWFYVARHFWQAGVLDGMVEELVSKTPSDIRFFGITTKVPARLVFERHDLVAVTKCNMPDVERWAKRVGLGNRLPKTALRTGPSEPKEGERWLFVQLHLL